MANQWTKEQELSIHKQDANILVSASAGSGKTAVLVERVVQKVLAYQVDIDRLLVVTFTNASAMELKERLLQAIEKKLQENPKDSFLKRQIHLLNRASITTIHSFCLELIRSHFHILGIDPNIKICDETESYILKNKAVNKVLEAKYEHVQKEKENGVGLYQVLELFSGKDENVVEYLLKMYQYIQSFAYPFEWFEEKLESYTLDPIQDLCETSFGKEIYLDAIQDIQILCYRIDSLREDIAGLEDFEKFAILLDQEREMLKRALHTHDHWNELYAVLSEMQFKNAPRYTGNNTELKEKILNFRKDILKPEIKKIKESVYDVTEEIIKDNQRAYPYLQYLYEMLTLLDAQYQELKHAKNVIDFQDIEHMALALLIEEDEEGNKVSSEVAHQLQQKFVEVYTDEYQDTSFVQEAILQAVSGGKNRFMVGDMKQSIYRFRQAMPEIFNQKYDSFEDLNTFDQEVENCRIILDKNFRSREHILASINYIFERIMSKEVGECSYTDSEALKFGASYYPEGELPLQATEIQIVDVKQTEEEETSEVSEYLKELKDFEIESMMIAKRIQQLVGVYPVWDTKNKQMRPATYQDIVILMKNMKDRGNILEKTLKDAGIPTFSDAVSSLFEGDEVRLVLSFLRVLDNPLQEIPLVSVMYSIIGGFSLEELAYIKKENKNCSMYDALCQITIVLENMSKITPKEEVLLQKAKDFLALLDTFTEYVSMYRVSEVLVRLYKETNIYYQFALTKQAKNQKANLDLLVELANKNETGMASTLQGYISYIDSLKDKTDTSTAAAKMLGENEDVVRIMTIHKSKGLEFPIVMVCDTNRKYNMRDFTAPIVMHHSLGLGINIMNEKYPVTYPSVIKQAIKNRGKKEMKSEELRVLYVALTRAREKLILFGTVNDYSKWIGKQFVLEKDGKIDSGMIQANHTYLENIMMALHQDLSHPNPLFHIQITQVHDTKFQQEWLEENLPSEVTPEWETMDERIHKLEEVSSIDQEQIDCLKDTLLQHVTFTYPYLEEIDIPERVSVSSLKEKDKREEVVPMIQEPEEQEVRKKDITQRFSVPTCLLEEAHEYTPVRKGTLIHFILEHLDMKSDYTKASLKTYLDTLVEQGVLQPEDRPYISISKLDKWIHSSLGKEMKNATYIAKEQEFILQEEKFSKSIIQGVIDLYYELENGNIVLVDFKTDRLTDIKLLKKRYQTQLAIYKCAIEKLTGKTVERVYLYSFYLDVPIPME